MLFYFLSRMPLASSLEENIGLSARKNDGVWLLCSGHLFPATFIVDSWLFDHCIVWYAYEEISGLIYETFLILQANALGILI